MPQALGNLAVVGATGAVGRTFCALLDERGHLPASLTLLASARSAGTTIEVAGDRQTVAVLSEAALAGADWVVFAGPREVSARYAPLAVRAGAIVVDNSSAFRLEPGVPLVVPEVNAGDLATHQGLIANPNCSTALLTLAMAPLHQRWRIERAVVCTYQAASGAGGRALQELREQSSAVLAGRPAQPSVFPHPLAFNLFSHDSPIDTEGSNREEAKLVAETRKILHAPALALAATCVRVPVFRAHTEAVHLTFAEPVAVDDARATLAAAPGLRLVDDRKANHFPMPIEATDGDDVLVGRVRRDASVPDDRGLALLLCGDQLRKGAALNALQIMECLGRQYATGNRQ